MSEATELALTATSTTVTAKWGLGGEPPAGWVVAYRVEGAGAWTELEPIAALPREATIAGLTPATKYEVRVDALGEEEAAEETVSTDGPLERAWLHLVPPAGVIERIAVGVTHVYASGGRDAEGKPVLSRASIEAVEPEPSWRAIPGATAVSNVWGLAVDATYLYFVWESEEGGGTCHIGRVKLDGTGMESTWVTIPFEAELGVDLLAVNATHIYFSRTDEWLGRCAIDGTGMEPHFVKAITPGYHGGGLVLTRSHVVMTWIGAAGEGGTWWALLDGSEPAEGPEHLPRAKGIARLPSGRLLLAEQALTGEPSSVFRVDALLATEPEGPLLALEESETPQDLHTDSHYGYYVHEGVIARLLLSALGPEGEEEPEGGSEPERGVAVDFFAEHDLGASFELWLFVDPATESGYRLTLTATPGPAAFTFVLEVVVAGVGSVLGESGPVELTEAAHAVELARDGADIIVLLNHAVRISAVDSTFLRGFIGLGGSTPNAFGTLNFRYAGHVLDTLAREEDPLDNAGEWALPFWWANTGKCFSAIFGWVAS